MKKQEMIDTLKTQGENINKELTEMQLKFNNKKEQLLRIEGALEALSLLDDEPQPPAPKEKAEVPDHTSAAKALGI